LERGADPDVRDAEGRTAFELSMNGAEPWTVDQLARKASLRDFPSLAKLGRLDFVLDAIAREKSADKIQEYAVAQFERTAPEPVRKCWKPIFAALEATRGGGSDRLFAALRQVTKTRDALLEGELLGRAAPVLAKHLNAQQLGDLAVEAIERRNASILRLTQLAGFKPDDEFRRWASNQFAEAAKNWDVERCEMILSQGVVAKEALNDAAILATIQGNRELLRRLLDHGVETDLRDERGSTLLILALERQRTDIVEDLLTRGADVRLRNRNSHDALAVARRSYVSETVIKALERKSTGQKPVQLEH
jgi:hypothetical protein